MDNGDVIVIRTKRYPKYIVYRNAVLHLERPLVHYEKCTSAQHEQLLDALLRDTTMCEMFATRRMGAPRPDHDESRRGEIRDRELALARSREFDEQVSELWRLARHRLTTSRREF